jgi:hypothetical protein
MSQEEIAKMIEVITEDIRLLQEEKGSFEIFNPDSEVYKLAKVRLILLSMIKD